MLRVIGQARETYILAEGPDGVYLIDQHAAHERVLYEEIRGRMDGRSMEAQALLAPETVELTPEHVDALTRTGEALADAGFSFEPFGDRAVLLRAVPGVLGSAEKGAPGDALTRILDDIVEGGEAQAWRESLIHSLACHAAVRAGSSMTIEESRELVRRLEQTRQPHTCPHGRPTMIHLSAGALEREFRRS
jgi:DNA mismatch repair protein MutL